MPQTGLSGKECPKLSPAAETVPQTGTSGEPSASDQSQSTVQGQRSVNRIVIKAHCIRALTCVLILGTWRQTDHLRPGPAVERASERASDWAWRPRVPHTRPGSGENLGESLRLGLAAESASEQAWWWREPQNRPGGRESLRTGPVAERASEQARRRREPQKGPAAERASDWAQWQTEGEQLVRSWHRDKE